MYESNYYSGTWRKSYRNTTDGDVSCSPGFWRRTDSANTMSGGSLPPHKRARIDNPKHSQRAAADDHGAQVEAAAAKEPRPAFAAIAANQVMERDAQRVSF